MSDVIKTPKDSKKIDCDAIVCTVYDSVLCSHSAPLTFANKAAAIRWFANHTDPNKIDFILFYIGNYSSSVGTVVSFVEKEVLARGTDYGKKEED